MDRSTRELRKRVFREIREIKPDASYRDFIKIFCRWQAGAIRIRTAIEKSREIPDSFWNMMIGSA